MDGAPPDFAAATHAWLDATFDAPTSVQTRGWPLLAAGRNALLVAPTGSGKTLAAFLAAIDRLGRLPRDAPPGVRVLYVSPLKALVYDIERNLRRPLEGIAEEARRIEAETGEPSRFRAPRVGIRTGDSTARERRQLVRDPAEILVTTPESLYLMLGSKARETLRHVETIIVDEIHALAPTKRGTHLMLSLERVARRVEGAEPQRVGLSATARPTEAIARFLGGDRAVEVVDTSRAPDLDLVVSVPVPDMTRPEVGGRRDPEDRDKPVRAVGDGEAETSLWPAIYPELLERIRAHRSSILFVNSRALCERLAHRLNELAGEELVRAHHGSLAHDKRKEIEESLAAGTLRSIVATSSLELGIDMAAVELVLLVESPRRSEPRAAAHRARGHAVGATSRGVVFPKHRGDLLEATVAASGHRPPLPRRRHRDHDRDAHARHRRPPLARRARPPAPLRGPQAPAPRHPQSPHLRRRNPPPHRLTPARTSRALAESRLQLRTREPGRTSPGRLAVQRLAGRSRTSEVSNAPASPAGARPHEARSARGTAVDRALGGSRHQRSRREPGQSPASSLSGESAVISGSQPASVSRRARPPASSKLASSVR